MRASEEGSTGAQGRSEVRAKFEALHWGPVEVGAEHDLGTDLLVHVRDERLFDLGLLVGVQVKTGPSYFQESEQNDAGEPDGWWYREDDGKHFNYWINHAVPHLLVLHDRERHVSFWAHVTAERVESTGKGNKIFVSASQRVEPSQLEGLLAVARTQRTGLSIERSVWDAGATKLSPGQRYRYALLVPRIVAPHPNRSLDRAISPPEAVALIMRGRLSELARFAEKDQSVPDPEKAALDSKDWGWRFVGSFWRWVVRSDATFLRERIDDAADATQRTAACISFACSLFDDERLIDAVELLTSLIDGDDAAPLDWAWMLVQRGRFRLEMGDVEQAREDLLAASKAVAADTNDLCSTILTTAAVSLLWSTMDWGNRSIEELIKANDTVVAWWRSQTISAALAEATDRSFLAWVEDTSVRFAADDTLLNGLLSASLGAHLGGEHDSWRANSRLLGRHELMGSSDDKDREIRDALGLLRICGDSAGLEKAADRLWKLGPLGPLKSATEEIHDSSWTHTATHANFVLWEAGGDLLPEDRAFAAAEFCLDVLRGAPSESLLKARPTFLVPDAAADALSVLLSAAGVDVSRQTIEYLVGLSIPVDDFLATDLCTVVDRLKGPAFDESSWEPLRSLAIRVTQGNLAASILGRLTNEGDGAAQAELVERASRGDLYSLSELRDPRSLNEQGASAVVSVFAGGVESLRDNAHNNQWGFGVFDLVDGLARSNLLFPSAANWELLLDVLADPKVLISQKVACCRFLAEFASDVPAEVVEGLRACFKALQATPERGFPLPGKDDSFGGVLEHLAIAIGLIGGQDLARRLADLAMHGWEERRDLARALAGNNSTEMLGALAALAGDDNTNVWTAAGTAAARRVVSGTGGEVEHEIARLLAQRDGVLGAHCVLAGLSHRTGPMDAETSSLVHELTQHPSARVRLWAERVRDARVNQKAE